MDARTRFAALEMMCRERARMAERDVKYWLAEADEWARFKQAVNLPIESVPLQLDMLAQSGNR
jgi:hypothetical protein